MEALINGKPIAFEAGDTILTAARRVGCYIPSLCELADIDHAPGTCRVCLVEERRAGQTATHVVTACNTPMEEGIEVFTRTPKIREMQKLQTELLLADHDQDCATCVRHGNCELQDVAQFVGLQQSRFANPIWAKSRPVDRSSLSITRDMGKCIRCQRCVAVCRDVQGIDALSITERGIGTCVEIRGTLVGGESECVSCGQCVMVCPTGALAERDDTDRVIDHLYDPDIVTVFQFAPAVRVGFADSLGIDNAEGQIITALRKMGADIVIDTNFAADLVIMEEGTEVVRHIRQGKRPTFTSCCPGWVNFVEKNYPDILPHLSSARSPQQCLGSLAKTYLAEKMEIDPARMRVISIMPCTAKKDEMNRPQLAKNGVPDVDVVLTIREFARLLRREGIDLAALEPGTFDNPHLGGYSGAGAIFGTTGGVMEAAVRSAYFLINGKELPNAEVTALRSFENIRTATVAVGGGLPDVNLAICHGLKAARDVVEGVLSGKYDFDFIEVMACPGGCVTGGGHLRHKKAYQAGAPKKRVTLFDIDAQRVIRQSHNNPQIQHLYSDYLGEPMSERAHHLLHTWYTDRKKEADVAVKEIRREIRLALPKAKASERV
ncbi:(2Fe-2S)-binding protein [Siculibacillus lacustris]|uniref:(2Fe-2S)-binding protein n=1 Tax=Siculibacillus lacustris TaxID=1549641 RepID=A0A4Q9VKY7_9HYPH|nr:2Fe-2S iron-sulfur cluster binding domain-containing protein [Siculibacillus lacustris]TBW36089.1 (2Fe-2S)-binding protein [Siculibacillus lacustris]